MNAGLLTRMGVIVRNESHQICCQDAHEIRCSHCRRLLSKANRHGIHIARGAFEAMVAGEHATFRCYYCHKISFWERHRAL
jgi:hypothetical protein